MATTAHHLASIALTVALAVVPVYPVEDPPSHSPTAQVPQPRLSKEQWGHHHHAQGAHYRDKALTLETQLQVATTDKARHKLSKQIAKNYRMAASEFELALYNYPTLYQAATGLGCVLGKTENYPESLEACDLALSIEPGDVEAVACRARAFLGMGQLEDAKQAYEQLFALDRARAHQLLATMRMWLDQQFHGASDVPPSILEYFAEWLGEQAAVAGR
jgi:tetratricopeptide (TPR) repeat protein